MISVVIRNKNEANYLKDTLSVLRTNYGSEISEIILVDNLSSDNSIAVAESFNCIVITIKEFTYGKALNLGIKNAANEYILLLSAHVLPVGSFFFKTALDEFSKNKNLAGIRFINSYDNYIRALQNDCEIEDGLNYGLMNACSMIKKSVWEKLKFDENLVFSEDKYWSEEVLRNGFQLKDVCETFFYQIKRNKRSELNRWKNETMASYQLNNKKYPGSLQIIISSIYRLFVLNVLDFFKKTLRDIKILKMKFTIKKLLK